MRLWLFILLFIVLPCEISFAEELVRIDFEGSNGKAPGTEKMANANPEQKLQEIFRSMEQGANSATKGQETREVDVNTILKRAENLGLNSALAKLSLLEASSQLSSKEIDTLLERTASTAEYDPKTSQNDTRWIRSFLLTYRSICIENKYSLYRVELLKKFLTEKNYDLENPISFEDKSKAAETSAP